VSDSEFDLIVLGGGSGGLAAAFRAAEHGARVAILEPGELGGTCVNLGCVPKKAMWLAAELAQRIEMGCRMGFDVSQPKLDWREFVVHRQRYIAGIHDSYRKRLDGHGVVRVPSYGRLVSPGEVETREGLRLSAPHILIATGSHPTRPPVPGAALGGVSDDFFNLCHAPPRVAILGGGYIAVELASLLQALGSRVDLFVRGARLLESFDAELSAALADNLRQAGVRGRFGYRLGAVEPKGEGVRLVAEDGTCSEHYDLLLFATGREANTRDLGLEAAGVSVDEKGAVVVDDYQNTSVKGIYAIGDVTGKVPLTPVAIAAARRLMNRIFGGQADAKLDYRGIPTVVFAHPPLGRIGLTEEEARLQHGDAVSVYRASFRPMLDALADTPMRSLFKLVCIGQDRRVVGLHLLGDGSDEMLQGFAVAIKRGATLEDLHDTVAIHPTSAEEVVLMR
jgi:glutathione reductase (NADPH)